MVGPCYDSDTYRALTVHKVWALLWIVFEVAILTGFVLLGIECFKLDSDQMAAQAGTYPTSSQHAP